jgi:hypothetical protein
MGINDGWQSAVQTEHAVPIYESIWGDCEVIENDTLGETEKSARILDYGDVDKIVRIGGKQIHMAQRFRKPFYKQQSDQPQDPDFTLRYSRPDSDHAVEYERLMNAVGDDCAAYPRRYSFGRVHEQHDRGLYELYILDTDRLVKAIQSGEITESGPIPTQEGQTFMAYKMDEIRQNGIVVESWEQRERPDDPEKITAWVSA